MKDKNFPYWLKVSLGVHLAVFVLLSWNFSFHKNITSSLKVDVIDLPDKIKKIERTSKKVKKKRPPQKKKKDNKTLILKQKQSPKNLKKEDQDNKSPQKETRTMFKGNFLSQGQSLEGLNRLSMERYYEEVGMAVRKHFVIPQWLDLTNLSATIEVTLDDEGRIITKSFIKESGNELFDQQALEAIIKAEPLPRPPDRLKKLFYKINFILKFPE